MCPCRDAPPLYYPASRCSGSLPQKLLIPLFLVVGGAVAGLVPLLEDVFAEIVDADNMVPHSCVDPTRVLRLVDTVDTGKWSPISVDESIFTTPCLKKYL